MRGGFWQWRSYVIIKVKGPRLEDFVNRAVAAGAHLYDVERLSAEMMVARVTAPVFRRLRVLCRAGAWRLSIVKRVGAPFLLLRLARRKGLIMGALAGLLFLYLLSSVVWFVEVEGLEQVPRERVLALAAECGLRPGVLKNAYSGPVVERQLLLTLDRLAWAYVETRGTLAVIHVAEKVVPDPALTMPGDIVAAFDGVLEEMLVLRGVPAAQVGDAVQVGQMLISGLIPPQDPLHAEKLAAGEPPYIKADGLVKARVWHEGYAEASLLQREETLTGRVRRRWRLQQDGRALGAEEAAPFATYTKEKRVFRPGVGAWRLPWELVYTRYAETEVRYLPVAESEALDQATTAAWDQVRAALPPGAVIATRGLVEAERVEEAGRPGIRIRVTQEALEDIAMFRPVAAERGPGAYRPALGPPPRWQPVPGP